MVSKDKSAIVAQGVVQTVVPRPTSQAYRSVTQKMMGIPGAPWEGSCLGIMRPSLGDAWRVLEEQHLVGEVLHG